MLDLILNAVVGPTQTAGPDPEHEACKVQLKEEVSMQFIINWVFNSEYHFQTYVRPANTMYVLYFMYGLILHHTSRGWISPSCLPEPCTEEIK